MWFRLEGERDVKDGLTFMKILVQVVKTTSVEAGGSADDSMDLVAFRQEEFRPLE